MGMLSEIFSLKAIFVGFASCALIHTATATLGIPLNLGGLFGLEAVPGGGCADGCGLDHGFISDNPAP